jgi:hypothetical protein
MKTSDATHNTTSIVRSHVAVGKEIPRPVASATYAATQAGHLGISASVALGTIQPAISLTRRHRDAGQRALSPVASCSGAIASHHACASAAWQHALAF